MTGSRPLDRVGWPVRTERLSLRPATIDDVEATWRFRRLESVSQWLTRAMRTIEEYRTQFEDPEWLAKTILIERDGEVIGDLMLAVRDDWAQAEVAGQAKGVQAELGWVLDPAHTGHGYATEAVQALIRICFEDLGLRRVRPTASPTTRPPGGSWSASGCAASSTRSATRCTARRSWLLRARVRLLADEWRR